MISAVSALKRAEPRSARAVEVWKAGEDGEVGEEEGSLLLVECLEKLRLDMVIVGLSDGLLCVLEWVS